MNFWQTKLKITAKTLISHGEVGLSYFQNNVKLQFHNLVVSLFETVNISVYTNRYNKISLKIDIKIVINDYVIGIINHWYNQINLYFTGNKMSKKIFHYMYSHTTINSFYTKYLLSVSLTKWYTNTY